jgi:hypothetical protein
MKNKITGTCQIQFSVPPAENVAIHHEKFGCRLGFLSRPTTLRKKVGTPKLRGIIRCACRAGVLIFQAAIFMQLPVSAVQNVTLSWDPSADPNVTGYNIYYGGVSGVYTNEICVGNVTGAVVSGLTDGGTYSFAATSYDAVGNESTFSNIASYSVPSVATLSMNTVKTQGITTAVSITANGAIPDQWTLESSPDLKTWTPIAAGTNSNVSISVPVTGIPSQFFRLKGE